MSEWGQAHNTGHRRGSMPMRGLYFASSGSQNDATIGGHLRWIDWFNGQLGHSARQNHTIFPNRADGGDYFFRQVLAEGAHGGGESAGGGH
jgi:hypothetical protein